jgi:hypothetical protein
VLRAERRFVRGERDPRQFEALRSPPAGDQRKGQLAALAMGVRVVGTKAPDGSCQQILAGEDRLCPIVLGAQRGLERLAADNSQRNQIFADPSAEALLARQGKLYVLFSNEALRDQKFTEKHRRHSRPINATLSHSDNSDGK